MIHARIDKNTNIVVSVEVASPEWVADWTQQNPNDACFYAVADVEGELAAAMGWLHDNETGRYIPPMPDAEGTWEFDRDEWRWVDLDAPPLPPPDEDDPAEDDTPPTE